LNEVLALSRNKTLAHVAQRIGQETLPVLVLGDMNSTPYSPWYQDFRQTAGLHEVGFSGWPTWGPWPQGPLILPLDRSLVRGLWATMAIGPVLGSDHRAVMVDIH
jgi:endonuclease/exonuclease/phosphatase (EEP) superfamily protein YafD